MIDVYPPLRLVAVDLRDVQVMTTMNIPTSELSALVDSTVGLFTLTGGKIKYGNIKFLPSERIDRTMRVVFDDAAHEYQLHHIRYFVVVDDEKTKNWVTIGHTMKTFNCYDLWLKYNSTKSPQY